MVASQKNYRLYDKEEMTVEDKLYTISVSSLEVRKNPRERSGIFLNRGTVVKETGNTKQHKKEVWLEIQTLTAPTVKGYVNRKYVNRI